MACNIICPENCHPHSLILSLWYKRYKRQGLPNVAKIVLPYQKENIFRAIQNKLPKNELKLVNHWKKPPRTKVAIYAGCNILIQPYIMRSHLFETIDIYGDFDICCGEPLFRMGCKNAFIQVAKHVARNLNEQRNVKKWIIPCLAGFHLFKDIYPFFGIKINAELISILDWIWERIKMKDIKISKKLKITATLHDNCWAKCSGDHFLDLSRKILNKIGVEIIEMQHSRESSLCCGMAAPAANYSISYTISTGKKRINEAIETGTDIIVNYCGGCNWIFALLEKLMLGKKPKILHLLELVQMGLEEKPDHRIKKRSKQILSVFLYKFLRYKFGRRFWINKI